MDDDGTDPREIAAQGRILRMDESGAAEAALRRRYRLGRRLFGLLIEPIFRWQGKTPVYLEIIPDTDARTR